MGEKIFRPRNLPRRAESTMLALTTTARSLSTILTTRASYSTTKHTVFF
jgi:hypothetical protein